jgi:hypothetical protein
MAAEDDDDQFLPPDLSSLEAPDDLDYQEQRAIPAGDDSVLAQEVADLRNQLAAAMTLIRWLQEQAAPRTVASSGGGGAVVVRITGNASGGGKYNGRILTGTSTAVAAGTLAMPAGMTVPGADNALILNLYEDGKITHDLVANTFHIGVPAGVSAGKTVVHIQSLKVQDC